MYNLMHGRNRDLLKGGFEAIESVYTNSKYDSPLTTWLHTPNRPENQITVLYPSYQWPSFVLHTEFAKFKHLDRTIDKDLKIKWEPYAHEHGGQKDMIQLLDQIGKTDTPLPQFLFIRPLDKTSCTVNFCLHD